MGLVSWGPICPLFVLLSPAIVHIKAMCPFAARSYTNSVHLGMLGVSMGHGEGFTVVKGNVAANMGFQRVHDLFFTPPA